MSIDSAWVEEAVVRVEELQIGFERVKKIQEKIIMHFAEDASSFNIQNYFQDLVTFCERVMIAKKVTCLARPKS